MNNPQILMAFSAALAELACYKVEHGELGGQTEYRCTVCSRSVFGPEKLDLAKGAPCHSECFLKQQLADREKEIMALRTQLGAAEKK